MGRLTVEAAARWSGGQPDQIIAGQPTFQIFPILLAIAVMDDNGGHVKLAADDIHVLYQQQPDPVEDTLAVVSDFTHYGPTIHDLGWQSCIVRPQGAGNWLQDEVFLNVVVRRANPAGGLDRGQTLILARYHQFA